MMKLVSTYIRSIGMVLVCSFLFLHAYSQEEVDFKDTFLEAGSDFLYGDFKDALAGYQKLYQLDPENFNINYLIGRCYLNDPYQVSRSIAYLEKAVKGTSPDYRTDNYRERMAPMEAYLFLGDAYRMNNRLDEAIETYNLFKTVIDPQVYIDAIVDLVDARIVACQVAQAQFSRPVYFTSVNLGSVVNERFDEVNPVISGDGSTLVFTRKLQFYDAVFYSSKQEDGTWSYPVNLTLSFGVDGNTYVTGISYGGDEIFVYRSDDYDGNIYVSRRSNDQWSKLEKLNDNINTKYWESHASISDDGKTLYFTSNRRGGYGDLDIYKSERRERGDWGPAINLGPVINTRYNEETPFVTDDGKTLYFSSMGHYNMGGYDIFYSTRLDNGQWSIPINVGYPLNTTHDDLFFAPTADGTHAYYSKYDPEDSYGLADIYSMEIFTVHPRKFILNGVVRTAGNVPVDLTQYQVSLLDANTGRLIDQANLNSDGTYSLDSVSGDLEIRIIDANRTLSSEKISIPPDSPSDVISHTSTIVPGMQVETPVAEEGAAEDMAENLPKITTRITEYDVTSDQSIPILLEVDRNTRLFIETIVNGQPFKTEDIDVGQNQSVFFTANPLQGINLLRFTVTNEEGLKNTLEVTINYTPVAEEMAEQPEEEGIVSQPMGPMASTDWRAGIHSLAEGELKDFLQSPELQGMQFGSPGELYNYLTAHALEGGFTVEEVDELLMRYLAQKNVAFFADELYMQASDSIAEAASTLLANMTSISTPEVLLDTLLGLAGQGGFSHEELRNVIYQIARRDRDALEMTDILESYSEGALADFLESLKLNPSDITESNMADARYLTRNAMAGNYSMQELEFAIDKASYEMDVNFLYLSLLSISSDSLRETLSELDLWKENIRNADELISHLFNQAESNGYTKGEVVDNIELIKQDPYYYVEEFRETLARNATGPLKAFLDQTDIRNLHIDTYEKLISYLLTQSQYHDFNLEMIYQLLIDIIDVSNVREFIDLLLQSADDRMVSAMHATDYELYSTPVEVVQYLLSVSDQYGYTRTDLINLLIKIMIERKPIIRESVEEGGWLSGLERSELVSALIIVNGLIIVLVIIFIFRRKQKRKADQPPD